MPSLAASVQAISPKLPNPSRRYPANSLRRDRVCYVMSHINAEPAGGNDTY